jgi:glycosyltransferase involved in cell wall biosynthesis
VKPIKVVHLSSDHVAFDTRIFQKECKSLAREGYDVTFVVPHVTDVVVENVQIRALPKPRGRLSRMTTTVRNVFREARQHPAEIYHFHDFVLIPVALLLRAGGKKVIYDVHEDVPRGVLSKDYIPRWLRKPIGWLVEYMEDAASICFSGLVAATPTIAERFKFLNDRTVVIHNFPLLQELAPPTQISWGQRTSSIAYVGGISPGRGIRELITAMDLLPDRLNVKLKLAGHFLPASLEDEMARLPGWTRVEVLGLLNRETVAKTLGCVRAGLVTFLPEPNHIRSMPNKLFEYMSAGIPVIASDFLLWREIIQGAGCGLLVNPLNPRAIARAIEYVLTHHEEAEAMGRRGRKAVENHYNWAREERKLLQLYADLVKPSCAA